MIIKRKSNTAKYVKFGVFILFLVLIFIFRARFVNAVLFLEQKYFFKNQPTELMLPEREELQNLRVENATLKTQIKNLQNEITASSTDEKHFPVFMLMGDSNIYGDFFVSLPKNITPYIGMNIFSTGNVVVGTVSEILPTALKIDRLGQGKIFTASSDDGEETVELQSLGSGLYVGQVSGGSKLSVGDNIVLRGYPKGVIGTVVEIDKNDTSLSNVFVRSPYNINDKEIFYVIQ
jgi:cell division protein FtsB